ncbi:MAG: hypothetical protein ACP5MV_01705 [Candidatus Parvarchaeum sp.]
MEVVGFFSGVGYKEKNSSKLIRPLNTAAGQTTNYSLIDTNGPDAIEKSFDYNKWNDNRKYNLQNFTGSLQREMGTGNIADLMAYNEIAKVQVAAEMPGAKVVGLEDKLSEIRRLNQLEQGGLEPHKNLGPFKLLRYEIVNAGALKTYDSNGNPKIQKMFRLKIEYGYRIIDKKKAYHQNMHDLALKLLQNAANKRIHFGNLDRRWFNDSVYADDLMVEFLSPYRWGGSYDYRNINLRDNSSLKRHGIAYKTLDGIFGGVLKGLVVGPRVSLVSTKPMTEERVRDLMSILDLKGAYSIEKEEENN